MLVLDFLVSGLGPPSTSSPSSHHNSGLITTTPGICSPELATFGHYSSGDRSKGWFLVLGSNLFFECRPLGRLQLHLAIFVLVYCICHHCLIKLKYFRWPLSFHLRHDYYLVAKRTGPLSSTRVTVFIAGTLDKIRLQLFADRSVPLYVGQ